MPKQVLQVTKFSGGLNSYADARDIEDNQFAQLVFYLIISSVGLV